MDEAIVRDWLRLEENRIEIIPLPLSSHSCLNMFLQQIEIKFFGESVPHCIFLLWLSTPSCSASSNNAVVHTF